MLSIIASFLAIVIPLLVIGSIVYIIVVVSKKDKNTKFKFSTKLLLQIYLYLISFVTLGLAVIGSVTTIRAVSSYAFDIPFSYTLYQADTYEAFPEFEKPTVEKRGSCYDGEPITFHDKDFCFDSKARRTDLINGITLVFSMALLFGIHQYALSKVGETDRIYSLKKVYTFGSLILYSITGIVSIPTAIYQTTNFILFEPTSNMYSTPTAPAASIAVVVMTVPLWIVFLRETMKLKED